MKKKSVAINAVLNVIRQCCTVLFPLLITKHVTGALGAANYGKVVFGNSVVEYFAIFAAFGIGAYAVQQGAKCRERPRELAEICSQIFTLNIVTTAVSYTVLVALLLTWQQIRDYRLLILIESSIILFTTLGTDWINFVFEDFTYITVRHILFQVLGVVSVLCFVRNAQDYLLYASLLALTKIGGNVLNIFYIRRKYVKLKLTRSVALKKHLKPLMLIFGGNIAVTVYLNFGTTVLTLQKGDAVTGVYSLGMKVYTIVKLLINAVISVVTPRLAACLGNRDEEGYSKLLNQLLWALALLVLPASVGLFVLAPQVITFLAGEAYLEGIAALRIFSVALSFGTLGVFILHCVLIPKSMEKASLIASVAGAVVTVVLNFLLIPDWSLNGAALSVLAGEMAMVLAALICARGHWKMELQLGQLLPAIPGCAAIAGICLLVQKHLHSTAGILVVAIAGSVVAYGLILLILEGKALKGIAGTFRKGK